MSYDISVYRNPCEHCGRKDDDEVAEWNVTYNVAFAFYHAGLSPKKPLDDDQPATDFVLDGARCDEAAVALEVGIGIIERDIVELRKRNPANGWGSVDGMLEHCLQPLLEACIAVGEHGHVRVW